MPFDVFTYKKLIRSIITFNPIFLCSFVEIWLYEVLNDISFDVLTYFKDIGGYLLIFKLFLLP